MGLVTTSLRTSRAARVRGRALQRGRNTRAATRTTRLAKTEDEAMMVNAGVASMRRDGRRRTMLGISLKKTRSEGRDVKTTGGALARRGCVGFGGCSDARPPTMQKTTGGAETSPVMDMLAGLSMVAGAWRNRRPVNVRIGVYSDRSGRCRDGMVRQARESVGAGVLFQCYGSGGYSDRSGRC